MTQLIDLTTERLKRSPITYTVIFTHNHDKLTFKVLDIQNSKESRLAVARDLEIATKSLRDSVKVEASD